MEGEQKAKFDAAYKSCIETTGVDEALIKRMRQKDFVEDIKLKTYVDCMFGKLGFIKDGQIQVEVIKSKLPPNTDNSAVAKVLESCKDKKGDVQKEVAYNLYVCFLKTGAIQLNL